ncbi:MAG: MoaD/ThiS family protein [Anaerolineaceae bacterium]|nr:MoaD/ThiS family protein [Anaerolineaceae bacterium]
MINIDISLYYHLRQKAGTGTISISAPSGITIKKVKQILEEKYPALITHLDNVMVLMDKKIVIDDDTLHRNTKIAFLTPIGGG